MTTVSKSIKHIQQAESMKSFKSRVRTWERKKEIESKKSREYKQKELTNE